MVPQENITCGKVMHSSFLVGPVLVSPKPARGQGNGEMVRNKHKDSVLRLNHKRLTAAGGGGSTLF